MPKYTEEAVILKATNFRDSDKIFSLFTKNRGKIVASAKGVRKISSRRGGNLDTLNYVHVGISEGNSKNYKIITEVKTINSFMHLKASLENSVKGFYIVELVYKLLAEGQKNIDVFNLLTSSLNKLDKHLNNEVSRVNAFEIKLMDYLGYEMYLDSCAKTQKPYDDTWETIKFSPNLGGFISDPSIPGIDITKEVADLLNALKTKDRINKVLLEDKEVVKEADKLIKMYVRDIMEDNVKTARVFGGI
jgi:DNA repair protein RecO (recombination protein O)